MIFNYKIYQDILVLDYLNSFYLSKSKINNLFINKEIKINGNDCSRKSLLKKGDTLSIIENENIDFLPEKKKLNILYEDDYLLIINKPANILVHPDSKDKKGTLCNIVAEYYKNKNYNISVKYAHRLDIDTTGIIVFCKDMLSMSYMNHYISTHEVNRYYLAFIGGRLNTKKGIIDFPIGEDRHHNSRRRVSKTGKEAITHYEVLNEFKDYSLVKIKLETGRTHQIRVHFSHIGHPLLGDELYGGNKKLIKRVALHSYKLNFIHPITKKMIDIEKDLPYDMRLLRER
ncbi:MAG: RluA family pseudouridine synthase [Anaeroplasma sp.]